MKVAVLGATGMLGSMLHKYLYNYYSVIVPTRSQFDAIRSEDKELVKVTKDCDWIINAIGSIPQRCNDSLEMILTNAFFPTRLAKLNIPVIQIATDCVYSGTVGPCDEYYKPDPIDLYGKTKHEGEVPGLNHIRCSIIGPESHVKSLLGWFLNQPKGAVINGYRNHTWNGITTLHFAKICRGMIESKITLGQLVHLIPADVVTKYELLVNFASAFNREDITIVPVDAERMINRSLSTVYHRGNEHLWISAGYSKPPTIHKMIRELSEYVK